MVSTSYPTDRTDWKGRFIADMTSALARRDDLTLSLWAPPGDLPAMVQEATNDTDKIWLAKLLAKGGIAAQLRGSTLRGLTAAAKLCRRLYSAYHRENYDIAHVNWLQNALPLWGIPTPALITVLGSDFGLLSKTGIGAASSRTFIPTPV